MASMPNAQNAVKDAETKVAEAEHAWKQAQVELRAAQDKGDAAAIDEAGFNLKQKEVELRAAPDQLKAARKS